MYISSLICEAIAQLCLAQKSLKCFNCATGLWLGMSGLQQNYRMWWTGRSTRQGKTPWECVRVFPNFLKDQQELETETASGRSWFSAQPTGSRSDCVQNIKPKDFSACPARAAFLLFPAQKKPSSISSGARRICCSTLCCWNLSPPWLCIIPCPRADWKHVAQSHIHMSSAQA